MTISQRHPQNGLQHSPPHHPEPWNDPHHNSSKINPLLYHTRSPVARIVGRFFFITSLIILIVALVFLNFLLYSQPLRISIFGKPNLPLPGTPNPGTPNRDPFNNRRLLHLNSNTTGVYLGASLDWEHNDLPTVFNRRLGHQSAVFQHFMHLNSELEKVTELKYIVDSVLKVDGSILAITVIPNEGLEAVTPQALDQLGRVMAFINSQGIPVFLRYGHEMNGNWYKYGQRPLAYSKSFQDVTNAVRKYTNFTYMVWAPNTPQAYPWFNPSNTQSPSPGTPEYIAMDTNHDGKINEYDDPYTPYYPGDNYVDWIGFSVFHFGLHGDFTKNAIPEPDQFLFNIEYWATSKIKWDIYDMFSAKRNIPFAIMETSAAYHLNYIRPGDPTELQIKQAWWRQVFDRQFLEQHPLIKVICWFDISKLEDNENGEYRDFRITWDKTLRDAFLADLPMDIIRFADSE